jgi:hypothetical protein
MPPSAIDDSTAGSSAHAFAKSVRVTAFSIAGLKGSFQGSLVHEMVIPKIDLK